jgi:hypothetical protein
MYILGLSSSRGTSRICPPWSPSEHQLTPALSPIWGLRPKPCRPEEVVYSPNDSSSHFTQRLFPLQLPRNIHNYFLRYILHHSYLLYITFTQAIISFIYITYSLFHFFGSSWQAGCPRSLVSDTLPSTSLPRLDISNSQAPHSCSHVADGAGLFAHRTRLPASAVLLGHSHLALSSLGLIPAGLSGRPCP